MITTEHLIAVLFIVGLAVPLGIVLTKLLIISTRK